MALASHGGYTVNIESLNSRKEFVNAANRVKIGNTTVNIRNSFYPKKELADILFSIASARLKEKSE